MVIAALDKQKSPPPQKRGMQNTTGGTWCRRSEKDREGVIKAIEYALKMAAKDISEKLSETLGNSR
jgi:hypothetical protein